VSDRLPQPMAADGPAYAAERASATPAHVWTQAPRAAHPRDAHLPRPAGLHALQTWLVEAICGPEPAATAGVVKDGPRLSGAERLDIYRHAYSARLQECLRDDYPVLAQTLGDARFARLCQEYVARHPSRGPSLNAFGRHMPELCRSTRELQSAAAFYAELASLEWALVEVTHAAGPAPLSLQDLQRVPPDAWGRARLTGSAALRVLRFEHPVNAHYQACRAHGEVLPLPAASPSATAVYRRGVELWRMDLTPAMTRVLRALLGDASLAEALGCIYVDASDPAAVAEAERSVMTWFQSWVANGFFSAVV